jgi:hypothetical protein
MHALPFLHGGHSRHSIRSFSKGDALQSDPRPTNAVAEVRQSVESRAVRKSLSSEMILVRSAPGERVHVSVASDGLLPRTLQQRRNRGRSVRWLVACHARRRQNGSMPELLRIIARHPVVTFMIIGLGDFTGHLRLASARSTGQWLAASAGRGGRRLHPPAGALSAY